MSNIRTFSFCEVLEILRVHAIEIFYQIRCRKCLTPNNCLMFPGNLSISWNNCFIFLSIIVPSLHVWLLFLLFSKLITHYLYRILCFVPSSGALFCLFLNGKEIEHSLFNKYIYIYIYSVVYYIKSTKQSWSIVKIYLSSLTIFSDNYSMTILILQIYNLCYFNL